jgi:hypothetical protein
MGQRIIRLRPVDGFCAETGAAVTLIMTIFGGIPVSTTHTITGSIIGVGALKRLSAVRWGVAERVVWAWLMTIPASALIAAVSWWVLRALVYFPSHHCREWFLVPPSGAMPRLRIRALLYSPCPIRQLNPLDKIQGIAYSSLSFRDLKDV